MNKNSNETCILGKNKVLCYVDPGRFDVCRGCPLKIAVKRLANK